jgi:nucleotide-binding universal stress UspA family protein
MKTILVPVDFTAITARVCETAVALAKSLRGRVVLLHCVPPPVITGEYGVLMEDIATLAAAGKKAAAIQLARLRKKLADESLPVETVELFGPPVPNIVEQASALKAAYIVIGSHDHSSFYDLLVGSTTRGVLLKAGCPVVVIHAEKKTPAPKKS